MKPAALAAAALAALAAGCARSSARDAGACDPPGDGASCLLPFPSSRFLAPDSKTATGWRVALPAADLPRNVFGLGLDPAPYDRFDGFSPATSILMRLPSIPDMRALASSRDFSPSLSPDAPILLLDMSTGAPVPYFAELDRTDPASPAGPILFLRPQRLLEAAKRYAVVVRRTLRDRSGRLVPPSPAFLRMPEGGRNRTLFEFLSRRGLDRRDLVLAFDFVTASDASRSGILAGMVESALKNASGRYRVDAVRDTPADPRIFRRIKGTFEAPSFLTTADEKGVLAWGPDGRPSIQGTLDFPFVVHIPQCARTSPRPLPVMIYGHGSFESAESEMSTPYQEALVQELCMVQLGTNWLGFTKDDLGSNDRVWNLAGGVLADFNKITLITERLMQAQVNFQVLAKLAKERLAADPALWVAGRPAADASRICYFGISLGATEGGTFMALSRDVARGALNAGAGEWGFMMPRSADFSALPAIKDFFYPSRSGQQILLSLSQALFDYTDPITYAPRLLKNPRPGVPAKRILLQESEGDAQVPNLATRILARTMGLTALAPVVERVPGLRERHGPLSSAYVQFDLHPSPLPDDGNAPPAADNEAHEGCRRRPEAIENLRLFLKPGGMAVQTCGGRPCSFPPARQDGAPALNSRVPSGI